MLDWALISIKLKNSVETIFAMAPRRISRSHFFCKIGKKRTNNDGCIRILQHSIRKQREVMNYLQHYIEKGKFLS